MNSNKNQKIWVGMSGGVDSSTSVALLKEQGFDVTGAFIKVWQPPFIECDWRQDREDAKKVSADLGIPFTTINLENEYKKEVVDYLVDEYKKGRTPNPDIMCNQHIKFGSFLTEAKNRGADFVATGHYARKITDENGVHHLFSGADKTKDQSYFLWTLTQEQLSSIIFPVGDLRKNEVRKKAEERGLFVAKKKDSQGICFLGKIDIKEFLAEFIPSQKGDVLNESGKIIGHHPGAFFFTYGERRGFVITEKTPDQEPLYVVGKNIDKNTITVATQKEKEENFYVLGASLENENWIVGKPEDGHYKARFRHLQELVDIELVNDGDHFIVHFKEPQTSVSPGQSLVVFCEEECLGGGVISNEERE